MSNIMEIKPTDIFNGPGVRTSIWFSGCPFRCKGCHNQNTWDFDKGKPFIYGTMDYIFKCVEKGFLKNVSILGGEPLHPKNYETALFICRALKLKYPNINIWLWTGYDVEDIKHLEILEYIDVIKCGKYIQDLHIKHNYYGSSNQKIYEVINGQLFLSEKYN